jgi:hypothetical protein
MLGLTETDIRRIPRACRTKDRPVASLRQQLHRAPRGRKSRTKARISPATRTGRSEGSVWARSGAGHNPQRCTLGDDGVKGLGATRSALTDPGGVYAASGQSGLRPSYGQHLALIISGQVHSGQQPPSVLLPTTRLLILCSVSANALVYPGIVLH